MHYTLRLSRPIMQNAGSVCDESAADGGVYEQMRCYMSVSYLCLYFSRIAASSTVINDGRIMSTQAILSFSALTLLVGLR